MVQDECRGKKAYYAADELNNNKLFRVYYTCLMSDDEMFGGIGVAICDDIRRNCCVFELRKPVEVDQDHHVVELHALIETLNAAATLGLKRLHLFCDAYHVYQYFTGSWKPSTNNKLVTLVHQLNLIQRNFAYLGPALVGQDTLKLAFKLARDAFAIQATKFAERDNNGRTLSVEQCTICSQNIDDIAQMFSNNNCLHRFCIPCMGNHVRAKLLEGELPECPHEKCRSMLEIESYNKLINPKLYSFFSYRIQEASIPPAQKVYCPYPKCTALMSKTELQDHASQETAMRKCVQCDRFFCINCEAPWHPNVTCSYFMNYLSNQYSKVNNLKSLLMRNNLRQCGKCKDMVERAGGWYRMSCRRCGHEFCHMCGAEWTRTGPTCVCRMRDQRGILNAEQNWH